MSRLRWIWERTPIVNDWRGAVIATATAMCAYAVLFSMLLSLTQPTQGIIGLVSLAIMLVVNIDAASYDFERSRHAAA